MKRSRINSVSAKKRKDDRLIRVLKQRLFEVSPRCSGCTKSAPEIGMLHASHIITRGSRPDLATHPDNIVLDCPTCHKEWDSKNKERQSKLMNYAYRIDTIRRLAPEIYHLRDYAEA
jgi:5-methylcytosine-specific restriction endonuclease McrA